MTRIMRPGPWRWPTALDLALAVCVTVIWEWNVVSTGQHLGTTVAGPRWLTVPLPLLVALPLLWRRTRPLPACALVMTGIVAQAVASGHSPEGLQMILLWVVVPYTVAAYSSRRDALIGLAITLAAFAVYSAQNDDIVSGRQSDQWAGAFFLVLAVGAWLAGTVVRGRRETAALNAHASALRRESQIAGTEERSRIARELHDIVAHNLSVVVVQAAGARARGDQHRPEAATLEKIERSGREALVEMRRLVGVLREDDREGPGLTPHPGTAQLPALAERVGAAGLCVDLRVDADGPGLPPAIDLSAYRIVQEALTNTVKHAGPQAHVQVHVSRGQDALMISVVDDGGHGGHDAGQEPHEGGGHGLIGMRERVAVFGGELHAAPSPTGGFAVTARLPISHGTST